MNTVATKLAEARKLIERGWTQRVYKLGHCYCAAGAMRRVALPDYALFIQMRYALREVIPDGVVLWNDAPGRTQAEVIEAFKRAEQLAGAE